MKGKGEKRSEYENRCRIDSNEASESTNAYLTDGANDRKTPLTKTVKVQPNEVVKQILEKNVGYDIITAVKNISDSLEESHIAFTHGVIDKKNPNIQKPDDEIVINQKESPTRQGK